MEDIGNVNVARLPLGKSDFRFLRECDKVYVDKTDFVYDLARRTSPLFLH